MAGLNDLIADTGSLKTPTLNNSMGGSSNKDLMASARMALSGNWGMAVLGYVLYIVLIMSFNLFVISSLLFVGVVSSASGHNATLALESMRFSVSLVELLVSGAFTVGFIAFFLGIAQEAEVRLDLLCVGFQRFWKSFGTYFFYSLFVSLWTLLFIIPGIIAAFRYAMAFFIIADDEDCGALEAIRRSKDMMKGNKWKLFCLQWRFFWWWLLATCFTFGLGYLWLIPYMQTSFAKFYEDVS